MKEYSSPELSDLTEEGGQENRSGAVLISAVFVLIGIQAAITLNTTVNVTGPTPCTGCGYNLA